jgi:flagellar hook-associated protein 1 FlgK
MSIAGALSAALTGLNAAARGAEVISSNLANALTEGYGRRELLLSSRVVGTSGAGVRVDGVRRAADLGLIEARRGAEAAEARARTLTDFLARLEAAIGEPGAPGALATAVQGFETALTAAAARPDAPQRLTAVLTAAQGLARQIRDLSGAVQAERMAADAAIAREVEALNAALEGVARLNRDIQAGIGGGRDVSALIDARQRLIDQVSAAVPLREFRRGEAEVLLYTEGGTILLDGNPARLEFAPAGVITPYMSVGNGLLAGLTLNGRPVLALAESGQMGGGRLGALFEVRDRLGPEAQARLDGLARDLIERFEDPAADPTRPPGAPGLFTDAGLAFDPLNETGLAERIAVNALADPAQGGAVWRLRDGLGAAVPGDAGQAAGLWLLLGALGALRVPASGGFGDVPRGAAGLAADLLTLTAGARQAGEAGLAAAAARGEALRAAELAQGVDSDAELQRLMLIEQAYAANARVIRTIDEMLQALLAI